MIFIENIKYHKTLLEENPKISWKNKQLTKNWYMKKNPTHKNYIKLVLWGRVKIFIKETVKPIIVSLVEESGHTIVWSPPHHIYLQPIELVWENIKVTVGQHHTTGTKFKDVKTFLIASFLQLKTKTVSLFIRKSKNHLQEFL